MMDKYFLDTLTAAWNMAIHWLHQPLDAGTLDMITFNQGVLAGISYCQSCGSEEHALARKLLAHYMRARAEAGNLIAMGHATPDIQEEYRVYY